MDFPGFDDFEGFELSSDNPLLFSYPGTVGGKTGFTDNARHTFAVGAERDGRRLGVVLLNSTIAGGRPYEQAEKLLDAGFDTPDDASVGELVAVSQDDAADPDAAAQAESADSADTVDGAADPDSTASPDGVDVRVVVAVVLIAVLLGAAAFAGAKFRRRG